MSCPTRFGCWTVGVRKGGLNFVKLGWRGTITRVIAVTGRAVAAARLNQISCVSMTSCELVDSQSFLSGPASSVQLGSWNGRKLKLTPDSDHGNFFFIDAGGLSCWQTTCVTVGTTVSGSTHDFAFILTIKHGTPGAVHFAPANQWFLNAVSCVSYSTGSSAWACAATHLRRWTKPPMPPYKSLTHAAPEASRGSGRP